MFGGNGFSVEKGRRNVQKTGKCGGVPLIYSRPLFARTVMINREIPDNHGPKVWQKRTRMGNWWTLWGKTDYLMISSENLRWRRDDVRMKEAYNRTTWPTVYGACTVHSQRQVHTVRWKAGEMKQRLAWNSGKPHRQSYRPVSFSRHTLLTMGTPLFHAKRCLISTSLPSSKQTGDRVVSLRTWQLIFFCFGA